MTERPPFQPAVDDHVDPDEVGPDQFAAQDREVFGWKMFDWATSVFPTTVTTALLGVYLAALVDDRGGIDVLGFRLAGASLWSFALALSAFLQLFILPITGTIADHTSSKKRLLLWPAYLAAAATAGLFLVTGDTILFGAGLWVVASIALSASWVVYNSYLPEIAAPEDRDRVSSAGVAYGYLGGALWLAVNFALILVVFPDNEGLAVRLSLGLSGVWMAVFTVAFSQRYIRGRSPARSKPAGVNWAGFTFRTMAGTVRDLARNHPVALRFIIAYLVFTDGTSTIISIAIVFGGDELGASTSTLLAVVLMIQFMAVPGALAFGRAAMRYGTKRALIVNLTIWLGLVVYGYADLDSIPKFWVMGAVLAMALGGVQSLSRSLFAQLIPARYEAEYFGFYEISSRGTSWIGPLLFGIVNEITGSQRQAILSLIVFFVVGIALTLGVDVRRGMVDAGQDPDRLRAI